MSDQFYNLTRARQFSADKAQKSEVVGGGPGYTVGLRLTLTPGYKVMIGSGAANVAGQWRWNLSLAGETLDFAAVLEQQFQKVEGVARTGNRRRVLHDFKLAGDELSFSLLVDVDRVGYTRYQFSGKVRGERIEGKALVYHPVARGAEEYRYTEVPWRAERVANSAYFAPTGLEAR